MDYFADIFLGSGALVAAIYCFVLSRKLNKFSGLDQELGTAIAVMSKQVDEMTTVLAEAKDTAGESSSQLDQMTARAEDVAQRLEMMLSALEDLPELEATQKSSVDAQQYPPEEQGTNRQIPDDTGSIFLRHTNRAMGAR